MFRIFKYFVSAVSVAYIASLLGTSTALAYLSRAEAFEQSFDMVWSTVYDSHWDNTFGGMDWEEVRKDYRPKIRKIRKRVDLVDLLQTMLNELDLSHFKIVSSSIRELDNYPRGGYVGLELKYAHGRAFVVRVVSDSPAARAGIQKGWRLKSIHRRPVRRLVRPFLESRMPQSKKEFYLEQYLNEVIQGSTGRRIRTDWYPPGERAVKVYMTPVADTREMSDSVGYLSSQRIEYEQSYLDGEVLYIRFNYFLPVLMAEIRRSIERAEGNASGVVLDLRSNLGGLSIMANGIAGLLVDEPTNLGRLEMKRGYITYQGYPQSKRFRGPVAILVDGGTASTSEILAAGLQEAGRARIFGETSLGESLPALYKKLPSGDVLQYAVGDYRTPSGYRIEKNGVVPDELLVPSVEDLENGFDVQLEGAIEWIHNQLDTENDAA